MNSKEIFEALTMSEPQSLMGLPDSFGIYALWDHERNIRYIGCTPKATEGFRIRVGHKHITGSGGRSHKFSQAYCTGRMWRYCKKLSPASTLAAQDSNNAKLAKKLRTLFIRKHCRITYIEIPPNNLESDYFSRLTSLESQLQNMAPSSMRSWEGVSFKPESEPVELVDILLSDNRILRKAAESQAALFYKHV